jgi:hypothetical protein
MISWYTNYKSLIMQSPTVSCHFLSLIPKLSNTLNLCYFLIVRPSSTLRLNSRKN